MILHCITDSSLLSLSYSADCLELMFSVIKTNHPRDMMNYERNQGPLKADSFIFACSYVRNKH